MSQYAEVNTLPLDAATILLAKLVKSNPAAAPRSFATHCKPFASQHCDKSLTPKEQLHLILNPAARRQCIECNKDLTTFFGPARGWGKYCSIGCSTNSSHRKAVAVHNSQQRYGVDSPAKLAAVTQKRKSTNLKKYGHECNLHAPEIQQAVRHKMRGMVSDMMEKIKRTNLEKYGVKWQTERIGFQNALKAKHDELFQARESDRIILAQAGGFSIVDTCAAGLHTWKHTCGYQFTAPSLYLRCKSCSSQTSSVERAVYEFVSHNTEHEVLRRHHIFGDRREVDIFIPSINLAIEVNGVYWHSAERDNGSMQRKTEDAARLGIQLIHLWDHEWETATDLCKAALNAKMGNSKSIGARKTEVRILSTAEARTFLATFHRQGYANATVKLGLFNGSSLVSVLTLGRSRFAKDVQWEVIRYASLPGISVVGGLAKLLNKFEQLYSPESIGTYVDKSWGTGESYVRAGFQVKRTTAPGYFWINSKFQKLSRYETRFKQLPSLLKERFDASKSETSNMVSNGWWKCKDVGNLYLVKLPNQK